MLVPTEVVGGRRWSDVSAGMNHTCALTTEGDAYCWGQNTYLQSGGVTDVDCTMGDRCVPQPRLVQGGHRFTQIDAGSNRTCARKSNGEVWCWGGGLGTEGTYLGNGTLARSAVPLRVQSDSAFASVTSGCALTAAGQAWCWGPGPVGDSSFANHLAPVAVGGSIRFRELARATHTCGIATDGAMYCWGTNRWGQLVQGALTHDPFLALGPTAMVATRSVSTDAFIDVATGTHRTCVVRTDFVVLCAGWNRAGGLGDGGAIEYTASFTPVAGPLSATSIDASHDATCALRADGAAFCWGWNWFGGLGIGSRSDIGESTPQRVQGGPFTKISVGEDHTCGITPEARLYCWGADMFRQIGR